MSQQINPIAVRDTVLDLSDQVNFAVFRGAESITTQLYKANSATPSQHTYNIQLPSVQTVISRNLNWHARIQYTFTGVPAEGEFLVNLAAVNAENAAGTYSWEGADCLAPLPLTQLVQNMSCQINNSTLSVQCNRILDPLLRSVDKDMFQQWNKTTCTQQDFYADYAQALPQKAIVAGTTVPTAGTPSTALQVPLVNKHNSPFNTYEYANCNNDSSSRGSFYISSITGNSAGTAGGEVKTVVVVVDVIEPIFLSPFLFGEQIEQPGLSGITQLNFTMSMDPLGIRSWRWYNSANQGAKSLSVSYVQDYCWIEVMQYSPKVSDLTPSTIVSPLANFVLQQMPPSNPVLSGNSATITSSSYQLNSYPDKVFVYIDSAEQWQTPAGTGSATNNYGNGQPNRYGTIKNVNILLNNHNGLLSNFTQEELYKASVLSGSKQTWAEFSGLQMKYTDANQVAGNPGSYISTCGSVLVLDFAKIIQINEAFYAPSSLSTTQFQITVQFTNNFNTGMTPVLNCVFMYSGILVCSNGTSSQYVNGILTKENVLNAAAVPRPMNRTHLARYVGGGLLGDLKSIASSALPMVKQALAPAVEKLGSMAVDRLARKLRA